MAGVGGGGWELSMCIVPLPQFDMAATAAVDSCGRSRGAESGTAGTGYLEKVPEVAHVLAVLVFPVVVSMFL